MAQVPSHTHTFTFDIPSASSAEVAAGTSDSKAVTPLALAGAGETFLGLLGGGATGIDIFQSSTSAEVLALLDAGTTGTALFQDETAADARTTLELGSLATLSTISNANWSGADLAIENGGTGASSIEAARTNLGLGTAATADSTAFATSAQGLLADSAVQPGDGEAVPIGGTTGQVLAKASATDGDTFWTIAGQGDLISTNNGSDFEDKSEVRANLAIGLTTSEIASRNVPATIQSFVTSGYSAAGDGGGALWKRIADPGTVEAWHRQSADGAFWEIAEREITPKMFGAPVDGVGDDSQALADAAGAVLALGGTLSAKANPIGQTRYTLISVEEINLRMIAVDLRGVRMDVAHDGIALILGGNSGQGEAPPQRLGTVIRVGGRTAVPTVRMAGSKNQHIQFDRIDYLQLYADTSAAAIAAQSGSIAYCKFTGSNVEKLELNTNPGNTIPDSNGTGGAIQWINENAFFIERVTSELLVDGTYDHNHNRFYGLNLENAVSISFNRGSSNRLFDARMEAGPTTISFGAGTWNNVIIRSWRSSPDANPEQQVVSGSITDLGTDNRVMSDYVAQSQYATVAYTDISEPALSNPVGSVTNRQPDLQRVYGLAGNTDIVRSEIIPLVEGDRYYWGLAGRDGDTIRYRPAIAFFESDMTPVTDATGFVNSVTFSSVSGNVVRAGTGTDNAWCYFNQDAYDNASFVQVSWQVSSGQQANALATALFIRRANIFNSLEASADVFAPTKKTSQTVSTAVVRGFAPVGFVARRSDGSARYLCSFALDTVLSVAAASSATVITLVSVTGIASGDIIGINLDDRSTHWTTVSGAPSGNDVTLAVALPSGAVAGQRVVVNRWTTEV